MVHKKIIFFAIFLVCSIRTNCELSSYSRGEIQHKIELLSIRSENSQFTKEDLDELQRLKNKLWKDTESLNLFKQRIVDGYALDVKIDKLDQNTTVWKYITAYLRHELFPRREYSPNPYNQFALDIFYLAHLSLVHGLFPLSYPVAIYMGVTRWKSETDMLKLIDGDIKDNETYFKMIDDIMARTTYP